MLDDWALSATCAGLVLVASITAALLGMVLFAPPQNFEEMMGIPLWLLVVSFPIFYLVFVSFAV